jgi:hypothetical protein
MDPVALRRWVENHRVANQLEIRELATTWGSPEQSIAAAMALHTLYVRLHGWPPPDDPIETREKLIVWERFARLRQPYIK